MENEISHDKFVAYGALIDQREALREKLIASKTLKDKVAIQLQMKALTNRAYALMDEPDQDKFITPGGRTCIVTYIPRPDAK